MGERKFHWEHINDDDRANGDVVVTVLLTSRKTAFQFVNCVLCSVCFHMFVVSEALFGWHVTS